MSMFEQAGGFESVVASSRVRLARNIKGYSYARQTAQTLAEMASKVEAALQTAPVIADEFTKTEIHAGTAQAQAMVERHLISPELAQRGGWVIASRNENVSILIGEEDHVRLQVLGRGLCPRECLQEAQRLAQLLESQIPMDYDEKLGYLTACPTNVGTGLRASVMLHLPILAQVGGMQELIGWAGRQGCAVRGAFGEGTAAQGSFYQISNQVTLGQSEETLTEGLVSVCSKIIAAERKARLAMREHDEIGLLDRLCRSVGVLQNARRVDTKEATACLSDVLIGLEQGILQGISPHDVYLAEQAIQPATLQLQTDAPLSQGERDSARATWLREHIGMQLKIQ